MFTLAHISDPHVGPLPRAAFRDLCNKRLFGYLSWRRRRRFIHRPEVLAGLAADVKSLAPDHVAITGDLTNIALMREFEQAHGWLKQLGAPDRITVVPGNHDAYVSMPWAETIGQWRDYMTSDAADGRAAPGDGVDGFPIVRVRGDIAVVGLTSACPTPLFFATGSLGRGQLQRLETCLGDLGARGLFRVVLLHHPPCPTGLAWRKRLVDAAAFRDAIARNGAELILHGHDHMFGQESIASAVGEVPVLGVPSASAGKSGAKPQAHYHLYGIDRSEEGWRVTVSVRRVDLPSRNFVADSTRDMAVIRARRAADPTGG